MFADELHPLVGWSGLFEYCLKSTAVWTSGLFGIQGPSKNLEVDWVDCVKTSLKKFILSSFFFNLALKHCFLSRICLIKTSAPGWSLGKGADILGQGVQTTLSRVSGYAWRGRHRRAAISREGSCLLTPRRKIVHFQVSIRKRQSFFSCVLA